MSHLIGYHMSHLASFICIAAILIPVYCWYAFARTGRRKP